MVRKPSSSCCVCGESDARALTTTTLRSGVLVTLCGSHELMHRRSAAPASSETELRDAFGERRETNRRGRADIDELAASLTAAFARDKRVGDRRAG